MFDLVPQTFTLRIEAHPFADEPRLRDVPHGLSVAEAIQFAAIPAESAEVFIGGVHIPRDYWQRVRPNAGVTMEVRGVPGISGLIALVSSVVGSVATSAAAAIGITGGITIAGSTIAYASVIGLGVTYAAQSLATSLFAPSPSSQGGQGRQSFSQADTAQRFGITGTRNALNPFGAVPVVLGTHRFVPPYGASPYTEIVGNDQYLRIIVVWGYAPVDVSDIRIGNSPLSQFTGVEVEHDFDGTSSGLTLYPNTASQENLSIVLTTSYQSRTTPIDTDEIGVTVTFPSGLFRLDDNGVRQNHSVTVTGQYRPIGGSWVSFFSETITRNENSAVRRSWRVSGLTRGKYEVRLIRSTDSDDSKIADDCVWSALRAFTGEDPVQMAGVAKSAFRIKATDQLNGVADQINGLVSLKVPTWNGTTWTGESVTTNPAALFRYVLMGNANGRALPSSRVHDANLGDWYEHCATQGYEFSRPISSRLSVRDLLNEIAATGFASPRLIEDKWGVSIDRPKSTVVQHFTPRNSWGFSGQVVFPELPHALRVSFANRDLDYLNDERIVYDDGYTSANATKFETLDLPGTTDADNAFRQGRHFLASGRLRPEIFTFQCDMENLIAERGDLVRLTHDVALIGQAAGRVKAVDGTTLTLDDFVTFETGKTYAIRVRKADGTAVVQTATADVGSTLTVTVASSTGIAAGDLFMFGESGSESILAIIKAIEPGDNLTATLTCIPYNEDVYTAADEIPPYVSNISSPVSLSAVGPAAPSITNIISDESALPQNFEGTPQPTILLYVEPGAGGTLNARQTPATEFLIRWKKTGSDDGYETMRVDASTRVIRITGVDARQAYEIGAQAFDRFGGSSQVTTVASHTVAGFVAKPPALDTFRISTLSDQAYVEWTYPSIAVDVVGYEIRYHPDPDVATWAYMTTLSDQIPRSARSFTVPSRRGTYAIKAIDVLGNRSAAALFVNSTLTDAQGANAVVTISEAPDFNGERAGVSRVNGRLQLGADTVLADWGVLASVNRLAAPGVSDGFVSSGTYDFGQVDLGAVFTTHVEANIDLRLVDFANVMANWVPLASAIPLAGGRSGDEFSAEMQIAWSAIDSDTPSYGSWQRFSSLDVTARHVKFRLVLTTTDNQVSPAVNSLSVDLTMPNRIERGEDVASGTSTKTVAISPAFYALQSVTLAAQDMETGDYYRITNKANSGFDVTFYDSNDNPISRTFDWQAVGYGQEAA